MSPTCSCSSCPAHGESPKCPVYPSSSLTDTEWALLEPLLLPPPGSAAGRGGRPEKWPRRLVCDAIFYLSRGGIARA
ncbi:transposase, partial [Nocardia amamiensis]|uniref:transposase n=1 Tax=Nocardia amamiensis TaxID=404578 RepID=UPI0012F4EAEB